MSEQTAIAEPTQAGLPKDGAKMEEPENVAVEAQAEKRPSLMDAFPIKMSDVEMNDDAKKMLEAQFSAPSAVAETPKLEGAGIKSEAVREATEAQQGVTVANDNLGDNLGANISPQQVADGRQKLQNQYRGEAEQMTSPAGIDNMREAAITEAINVEKANIAKLAAARQKLVGEVKPTSSVVAPVLISTGLGLGAAALVNKMGDAAGEAQKFVIETAKSVVAADGSFDVAKKVTETFKGKIELGQTVADAITPNVAPLASKDGLNAAISAVEGLKDKAAGVAKAVMKGSGAEELEKAVGKAFEEKAGLLKKEIPEGAKDLADAAKTAVQGIADKREKLLGGDHVGELTDAFKEKMNGFAVGAVDKFNTTLPKVPAGAKLTALLAGTAIIVAAGHHFLTAGEREKEAEQKENIGKHTQAILAGQQKIGELTAARG